MGISRILIHLGLLLGLMSVNNDASALPKGFVYDEQGVPRYVLPDPLQSNDGTAVLTAGQWKDYRRGEILKLFEDHVYGRRPGVPGDRVYEVTSVDNKAMGGLATRKEITIHLEGKGKPYAVHVLLYLPNSIDGPAPVFLGYNFNGNHTVHADPGITLSNAWMRRNDGGNVNNRATEAARGTSASRWQVELILKRGYGLATAYYGDIEPDHKDGWKEGIRSFYKEDEDGNALQLDEWSAISAWSWGLSRIVDYLATDDAIDSAKIALIGHSRLGKTSLWAGANDERFAITISNNSGCGGAALSRRAFGETVERINTSFPHWFNGKFKEYNGNEAALPVDQHELLALMAPRPVYVASAAEDLWADPNGEFTSAKEAGRVYALFGLDGVGVDSQPELNRPVGDAIGYHIRSGGHDVTQYDWIQYLNFADRHFGRKMGKRPNVVFILTDDQRWDALSCMGNPHLKTPNIDRLAEEGALFLNHFCTTSLCSPSRASILGGLYAHAHGVTNNFTDYPRDLPTFPRQLQKAGYATAYIGKWHMGEDDDSRRPGFDHFITHRGQGKYFDTEFRANDGPRKVVEGYYTTVVTDMAVDWMEEQEKPFLLMLGHKAPHSFYFPEEKYADAFDNVRIPYPESAFQLEDKPTWIHQRLSTWHGIYGPLFDWRKDFPDTSARGMLDFENMTRAYWGTILSVDDSVGRIYQQLEKMGELDNTLFIFTSDNGLLNGEHGMVDKRTAHEPSLRIPLVVRYPRLVKPSEPRTIPQQTLTLDFAASILDICDADPLPKTQGRSWRKLLESDDPDWRTSWYYEYNYEVQFPYTPNVRAIRTDEWKYIRYPHGDGSPDRHMAELYNLKDDPDELNNLVGDPQYAVLVRELRTELDRLIVESHQGKPDTMPLDEGIKGELPDEKIR